MTISENFAEIPVFFAFLIITLEQSNEQMFSEPFRIIRVFFRDLNNDGRTGMPRIAKTAFDLLRIALVKFRGVFTDFAPAF